MINMQSLYKPRNGNEKEKMIRHIFDRQATCYKEIMKDKVKEFTAIVYKVCLKTLDVKITISFIK